MNKLGYRAEPLSEKELANLTQDLSTGPGLWLLAHQTDGVVWGRRGNIGQKWQFGSSPFPDACPTFDIERIQQLRLFDEDCELLVWRNEGGLTGRTLTDAGEIPARNLSPSDSTVLLFADRWIEGPTSDFTLVGDAAGSRQVVPLPCEERHFVPGKNGIRRWPLRLGVRNHYAQDDAGVVRLVASRLTTIVLEEPR